MDISVMLDNVKFNYRAGLIIECDDEILVEVNPEIDFVTLPGGRIKTMESSLEGLSREITEELNYQIGDSEFKGIIENFFSYDDKEYHELYFLYKTSVDKNSELYTNSLINEDSKKTYFKWIKKSEMIEYNLLPEVLRTWVNEDGFKSTVLRKK